MAVGILRATAHWAKQAHGDRFQAFAAKVRGLTTDCKYILPCPHAAADAQVCAIVGCRGNYTPAVIKDILLSGKYDHDIRREVLGSISIEDKSVNDLIRYVEAKEAARDAAVGNKQTSSGRGRGSCVFVIQEILQTGQRQQAAAASAEERPAEWRAPEEVTMLLR